MELLSLSLYDVHLKARKMTGELGSTPLSINLVSVRERLF
jgi:hypothetical protein